MSAITLTSCDWCGEIVEDTLHDVEIRPWTFGDSDTDVPYDDVVVPRHYHNARDRPCYRQFTDTLEMVLQERRLRDLPEGLTRGCG